MINVIHECLSDTDEGFVVTGESDLDVSKPMRVKILDCGAYQKIRILHLEKDDKEGNLIYICGPTITPVLGCVVIAKNEGHGSILVFGSRAIFKDEKENDYFMVINGVIKPVDIFVLISSGVFSIGTRVYTAVNKDDLEFKDKGIESNFDKLATNILKEVVEVVKTEVPVVLPTSNVEDVVAKEEKK